MSSWMEKFQQEEAKLAARDADPLRVKVETAARGMDAIGTAPLLDLLVNRLANCTPNNSETSWTGRSRR